MSPLTADEREELADAILDTLALLPANKDGFSTRPRVPAHGGPGAMIRTPRLTEYAWQLQVIAFARLHGWRVAHFRPGMNRRGECQTAVQGDGVGFPDLVLVKPGKCIVAELKSDEGRVSEEQRVWLRAFEAAGVPAYTWRPRDWSEVVEVLS